MPSYKKISIPYLSGVNSLNSWNVAKLTEAAHAENARSLTVGTVERRGGSTRLGDDVTATAAYALFSFASPAGLGPYRALTVGGVTSLYYLNGSSVWTKLNGGGTKLLEMGDGTTSFNISNPIGTTFRYTWNGTGTDPNVDSYLRYGSTVAVAAQNFNAANNGTFTVTNVGTAWFEVTNASGVSETSKTIGLGSITVSSPHFDDVSAEGCKFLVNGDVDNRYVSADGTTVVTASDTSGHLYNSPKARKVNYYKGRLYLSDYTYGTSNYPNYVMMSSPPLGITGLVDGDHVVGATEISVTDTKYIRSTDYLDVYRGQLLMATLTVTGKTESKITVSATAVALQSSDELWVSGTHNGKRLFRWTEAPTSGVDVRLYDTFPLVGGSNGRTKMLTNVGGYMMIASEDTLGAWDGSTLTAFDGDIGCVSDEGFVVAYGTLFFAHYTGIYATSGGRPKLISNDVDRYFRGATKAGLESSYAGRKGMSVFFSIGAVTLYKPDGSVERTLSDVVVEYDIRTDKWYVHTGLPTEGFVTYKSSSDPDVLLRMSSVAPHRCFQTFVGFVDDPTGTDDEIIFRVDTPWFQVTDEDEKVAYPLRIVATLESGNSASCFVALDDGDWYELHGQFDKGVLVIPVTSKDGDHSQPPSCRKMRFSIRSANRGPIKVSKVKVLVSDSLEEIDSYR